MYMPCGKKLTVYLEMDRVSPVAAMTQHNCIVKIGGGGEAHALNITCTNTPLYTQAEK